MFWVRIRGASPRRSDKYLQPMFSWRNKKNISSFWFWKVAYLEVCVMSFQYVDCLFQEITSLVWHKSNAIYHNILMYQNTFGPFVKYEWKLRYHTNYRMLLI